MYRLAWYHSFKKGFQKAAKSISGRTVSGRRSPVCAVSGTSAQKNLFLGTGSHPASPRGIRPHGSEKNCRRTKNKEHASQLTKTNVKFGTSGVGEKCLEDSDLLGKFKQFLDNSRKAA